MLQHLFLGQSCILDYCDLNSYNPEKHQGHKLRGLRITTNNLDNIPQVINYLSITVNDIDILLAKLNNLKRNRFVELLLPIENYSPEILPKLAGIKRLVICTNTTGDLNQIFAEMISHRFFPLVKGRKDIPLEFQYEYYENPHTWL